jgi:hypothetical protein
MASRVFSQLVVCCVLAGCGASRTEPKASAATSANAIVIRNNEMSGSILNTLRTRIPSMRVSMQGDRCPRIAFRGEMSARNQPGPTIYIDGTLTADSCVLDMVPGHDVERIEVYPSGDTPHSEIRRNPAGVILIYRRRE